MLQSGFLGSGTADTSRGMGTGRLKAHSDSWFDQRFFADCHWLNWLTSHHHVNKCDLWICIMIFMHPWVYQRLSLQVLLVSNPVPKPNSSPPTLTIGEVWAVPTLTGKDHRPEIGIYSHCIRCRWPKDFTPCWYQAGDEFVKGTSLTTTDPKLLGAFHRWQNAVRCCQACQQSFAPGQKPMVQYFFLAGCKSRLPGVWFW